MWIQSVMQKLNSMNNYNTLKLANKFHTQENNICKHVFKYKYILYFPVRTHELDLTLTERGKQLPFYALILACRIVPNILWKKAEKIICSSSSLGTTNTESESTTLIH
uniref:Uncharacterized protein n=1 Tax=Micrurus lemniscatus lemniscatus TaxID=129467 RepID=A0A2D4JQ95_MICLE